MTSVNPPATAGGSEDGYYGGRFQGRKKGRRTRSPPALKLTQEDLANLQTCFRLFLRCRTLAAMPANPVPSSKRVAGSGTGLVSEQSSGQINSLSCLDPYVVHLYAERAENFVIDEGKSARGVMEMNIKPTLINVGRDRSSDTGKVIDGLPVLNSGWARECDGDNEVRSEY